MLLKFKLCKISQIKFFRGIKVLMLGRAVPKSSIYAFYWARSSNYAAIFPNVKHLVNTANSINTFRITIANFELSPKKHSNKFIWISIQNQS